MFCHNLHALMVLAHNLCVKVKYTAYEVDLGIKKRWVTGDKVKRASENLKLADPPPELLKNIII